MPVLLVRHAHAGSRRDWAGEDVDRPLSRRGVAQARGLPGLLQPWSPQRVLSSPYRRCVETVEPLAAGTGLSVEEVVELTEGSGEAAVALVRSVSSDKVALCTHGDVIPEVLVALADEDRLDLGAHPRQAKGSVWVLESSGGRFTRATYLPPPT